MGLGNGSPPAGSRPLHGYSPGGSLGAEAEDVYANNNSNNVLTKNPSKFFSVWEFPGGGDMSPCPAPSLRPWFVGHIHCDFSKSEVQFS